MSTVTATSLALGRFSIGWSKLNVVGCCYMIMIMFMPELTAGKKKKKTRIEYLHGLYSCIAMIDLSLFGHEKWSQHGKGQ